MINFGSNDAEDVFYGENNVESIYYGDLLVYERKEDTVNYLTFTSEEPGNEIRLDKVIANSKNPVPFYEIGLEYRVNDSEWVSYDWPDGGNLGRAISLPGVHDTVKFRSKKGGNYRISKLDSYYRFGMTKRTSASGSVMTLFDETDKRRDLSNIDVGCLVKLFENCANLVSAPELPADSLSKRCYERMFQGCVGLSEAPNLPASKLDERCYDSMFNGCRNLVKAPDLMVESLPKYAYWYMFLNCTGLTTPPIMKAAVLSESCCYMMFKGCSSLTRAPLLPAEVLAPKCYGEMFNGCGSLNSVEVGFKAWDGDCTKDWLKGVASSGTFKGPMELPVAGDENIGTSRVPSGWTAHQYASLVIPSGSISVQGDASKDISGKIGATIANNDGHHTIGYEYPQVAYLKASGDSFTVNSSSALSTSFEVKVNLLNDGAIVSSQTVAVKVEIKSVEVDPVNYLTFTSEEQGNEIYLNKKGKPYEIGLEYKVNNSDWLPYSWDASTGNGKRIQLANANDTVKFRSKPKGNYRISKVNDYYNFGMTKRTKASGSVMTLFDETDKRRDLSNIDPGNLFMLFEGCHTLTAAPELPATGVAGRNYDGMFRRCTSLKTGPIALPAEAPQHHAYWNMFADCTSLVNPPAIGIITLSENCCDSMFIQCVNLETAPALQAKKLCKSCYNSMFAGCGKLNSIEVGFEAWDDACTQNWVSGVAGTGTFKCPAVLPTDAPDNVGVNRVPNGWTISKPVPAGPPKRIKFDVSESTYVTPLADEMIYNEAENFYENNCCILMTGRTYNESDYTYYTDSYVLYDKSPGDNNFLPVRAATSNDITPGLAELHPEQAFSRENLSKIKNFTCDVSSFEEDPATVIFLD